MTAQFHCRSLSITAAIVGLLVSSLPALANEAISGCPTPTTPYAISPDCLRALTRATSTDAVVVAVANSASTTLNCPTPTSPYAISPECLRALTQPAAAEPDHLQLDAPPDGEGADEAPD
jgi:hypothetical protein